MTRTILESAVKEACGRPDALFMDYADYDPGCDEVQACYFNHGSIDISIRLLYHPTEKMAKIEASADYMLCLGRSMWFMKECGYDMTEGHFEEDDIHEPPLFIYEVPIQRKSDLVHLIDSLKRYCDWEYKRKKQIQNSAS
jgi:hypothetical protein